MILYKVVEDVSSCLGDSSLEMTQHIASNHMDMCRFSGVHDVEYRKVVAALELIQKQIAEGFASSASPGSCVAFVTLIHLANFTRDELGTRRRLPAKIAGISAVSRNGCSLCNNKNSSYQNMQMVVQETPISRLARYQQDH